MSWYKVGTVSVTPGSNAVIGTGTSFIANSRVGDAFRGPDGGWYEVTNIASNTALSISPGYQGAADAYGTYALAPMQGYVKESADALRAATQVIASGVGDMEQQVATATEAAQSAAQSKAGATEQAGIAAAAAGASTDNKNAAQLAAEQSQSSAQASGSAADRSENARDSIIQSEQAAEASAEAAEQSAAQAEQVTIGKAGKGDNNDITSLRALSPDGFERIRQGVAAVVGATTTAPGIKGLVPAASIADRLKVLSGAGVYVPLPNPAWGSITGALSDQTDLKAALDAKGSIITKKWTSSALTWSQGGTLNPSHTLGVVPFFGILKIRYKQAVNGMAIGEEEFIGSTITTVSGQGNFGCVIRKPTATTVQIVAAGTGIFGATAAGAAIQVTPASTDLILELYA